MIRRKPLPLMTLRRFNRVVESLESPVRLTLCDRELGVFYPVGSGAIPMEIAPPTLLKKMAEERAAQ